MADSDTDAGISVDEGAEGIFNLLESDSDLMDEGGEIEDEAGEGDDESPTESDEPEDDEGEDDEEELEAEEDDEPEDETDDSDEPPTYTVKVDGEETEVTLDEALAGYQRQQAFTRKTQEVAEQRRRIQSEAEEVRAVRQQYGSQMEYITKVLKHIMPDEPDWKAVEAESPTEYPNMFRQYQERKQVIERFEAERDRVAREETASLEAEQSRLVVDQQDALVAAIPEWTDSDRKSSELDEMVNCATSLGYTPDEIDTVYDHRTVLLLRKAMMYDKLVAKGAKVKASAKPKKTPTLKPGTSGSRKAKKASAKDAARKRLAKTGSVDDAAEALFEMLENE